MMFVTFLKIAVAFVAGTGAFAFHHHQQTWRTRHSNHSCRRVPTGATTRWQQRTRRSTNSITTTTLEMNIPGPGQKPGPSPFQNKFKTSGNPNNRRRRRSGSNTAPPWEQYSPPSPDMYTYNDSSYRDWEENVNYLRQQSELLQLKALERFQRQQEEMSRKSREATQRAESMIQRSREAALKAAKKRSERHFLETTRFISTPFVAFALAFLLYPETVHFFHQTAQNLSGNRWVPVDGGELQWSVLLPALNGVVMTAVSLLYANLISTTGSQLRERQIKIQESLRMEVMGIRGLAQLLPYYPDNVRPVFGTQLMAYIQELVIELGAGRGSGGQAVGGGGGDKQRNDGELRSTLPSISDYRDELHRASMVISMAQDGEEALNDNIRERSYEMLDRVANGRMQRVTALQTVFPPLHYFTISALSVTILLVFLLETDRPVIQYLDSFQLRLMWGFLVGTITAIYCIGIDLNFPFVGTYTVPADRLLDESDELMRLIKGTFPGQANIVADMLSGKRGEIAPTEEPMPPSLTMQSMTPPPTSEGDDDDDNFYEP